MRIPVAICCLIILPFLTARAGNPPHPQAAAQEAQTPEAPPGSAAGSATATQIDPAKEADIRKLLQATGGMALMQQMMEGMEKNMRPLMANALPPGDYRDKLIELFFEKFQSKADTQQLIERIIPLCDKYLTDEDIKGLIEFYGTPLGKKTLTVLPHLTIDSQSEGMKWGQTIGRESMVEVLGEHPDLAKALEAAQQAAKAH